MFFGGGLKGEEIIEAMGWKWEGSDLRLGEGVRGKIGG